VTHTDPHEAARRPGPARTRLVVRVLRGELPAEEAAALAGVRPEDIRAWTDEFLADAEAGTESPAAAAQAPAAGIWVCAIGRQSLLSCLFIQAACPGQFPLAARALWAGLNQPPRGLRKVDGLELLHGRCGSPHGGEGHLHLFATKVDTTIPFEEHTDLSDWSVAAPAEGIVLLVDRDPVGRPPGLFPERSGRRGSGGRRDRTAAWAARQMLPLVIGAVGFSSTERGGDLQHLYGLSGEVPCVPGPAPRKARPETPDRAAGAAGLVGRSFAELLGFGELAFDADFAKRILGVLAGEIAAGSEV
jgi:hypothetical protein